MPNHSMTRLKSCLVSCPCLVKEMVDRVTSSSCVTKVMMIAFVYIVLVEFCLCHFRPMMFLSEHACDCARYVLDLHQHG